jgi:hypothetical protein
MRIKNLIISLIALASLLLAGCYTQVYLSDYAHHPNNQPYYGEGYNYPDTTYSDSSYANNNDSTLNNDYYNYNNYPVPYYYNGPNSYSPYYDYGFWNDWPPFTLGLAFGYYGYYNPYFDSYPYYYYAYPSPYYYRNYYHYGHRYYSYPFYGPTYRERDRGSAEIRNNNGTRNYYYRGSDASRIRTPQNLQKMNSRTSSVRNRNTVSNNRRTYIRQSRRPAYYYNGRANRNHQYSAPAQSNHQYSRPSRSSNNYTPHYSAPQRSSGRESVRNNSSRSRSR